MTAAPRRFTTRTGSKGTVRLLGPEDVGGLVSLRANPEMHEERLRRQAEGRAYYLGAIVDDAVAGFVLLSLDDKTDVHPFTKGAFCPDLIDLLVSPPLRNRGIGTALIRYAEALTRERGFRFLGLDVNPEYNARAQALYARLGYRGVGERHLDGTYENDDGGVFEDWCIDMIKPLRPASAASPGGGARKDRS